MIFLCLCTGANIFLSSDSVKLGDFGLSVQLKNMQKTQPNEIKRQRGTIRECQYLSVHLSVSVCVLVTCTCTVGSLDSPDVHVWFGIE